MSDLTTSLLELAARVEGGSGPDRELDAAIDAALFGGRAARLFDGGTPAARLRRSYGAGVVFDHTDPETNGGHVLTSMHRTAGAYTSGLDAVKALIERVLPGWSWQAGATVGAGAVARIAQDGLRRADGVAPDPARALLAALLYAKASETKDTAP